MRRVIAAWIIAPVLAACGDDAALDALSSGGRERVAAVTSGDSLTLADGRRVRLAGVEAPNPGEPHAQEARAALERLARGREVELLYGGARQDAYGRTLAQLRLIDRRVWLEGALLQEGAARVRTWSDNRALASEMLEAEARARRSVRGLWATPAYAVRLPQEVGAEARGFRVVEGRIGATVADGDRIRLGFAESPHGFAAEIPRRGVVDFRVAGVDPAGLVGALVRVRGPVRPTAAGPRLWLDHPEQLERLTAPKTKTPGVKPNAASDTRKATL
jgi:endonuclease YncB( thermonuclease family)